MTRDAQENPPTPYSPSAAAAARYGEPYVRTLPQLGRGLVWSDLVDEMEQEWAERQLERAAEGLPMIDLPLRRHAVRSRPDAANDPADRLRPGASDPAVRPRPDALDEAA